jgi:hypothetical protein
MNNNEKADYLYAIKTDAENVFTKGHMNTSAYLACTCGMWAHVFGLPMKSMFDNNPHLGSWFLTGWRASEDAYNMGRDMEAAERAAKAAEKKKKEDDKKKAKNAPKS